MRKLQRRDWCELLPGEGGVSAVEYACGAKLTGAMATTI